MDSAYSAGPQRREHRRHLLLAPVSWYRSGETAAPAEICDGSVGGVFVVPLGHFPTGLGPGEQVWIVASTDEGQITLSGAVRWRGYHPYHRCQGFGVKLNRPSLRQMELLFPEVAESGP